MNYSHLEDAALVRHVINGNSDDLATELAERFEQYLSNESIEEEIRQLEHELESTACDLENLETDVEQAKELAEIVIIDNGLGFDMVYDTVDEIVKFLCDKINELINKDDGQLDAIRLDVS